MLNSTKKSGSSIKNEDIENKTRDKNLIIEELLKENKELNHMNNEIDSINRPFTPPFGKLQENEGKTTNENKIESKKENQENQENQEESENDDDFLEKNKELYKAAKNYFQYDNNIEEEL
jgi:hypothetical protein